MMMARFLADLPLVALIILAVAGPFALWAWWESRETRAWVKRSKETGLHGAVRKVLKP